MKLINFKLKDEESLEYFLGTFYFSESWFLGKVN